MKLTDKDRAKWLLRDDSVVTTGWSLSKGVSRMVWSAARRNDRSFTGTTKRAAVDKAVRWSKKTSDRKVKFTLAPTRLNNGPVTVYEE